MNVRTMPDCCYAPAGAALPMIGYAGYNAGGDPDTAGLNYQRLPCPLFEGLTPNIREKWRAGALAQLRELQRRGLLAADLDLEALVDTCG